MQSALSSHLRAVSYVVIKPLNVVVDQLVLLTGFARFHPSYAFMSKPLLLTVAFHEASVEDSVALSDALVKRASTLALSEAWLSFA